MKKRILFMMLFVGMLSLSACTNQTMENAKNAVDQYNTALAEYNAGIQQPESG